MHLDDAVVLVTGSSRGIGAAVAAAAHARGARVVLHGRDVDQLDGLAADLGVKALRADLSDPDEVTALADAAVEVHGRVDAVVHCAGVGWRGPFESTPPGRLDEIVDVDLRAPLRLTRALLPAMVGRRRGHVAFVGSIAGRVGVAREAAYAATKSALDLFAESLRLELRGTGVGVSIVHPGAVATEFLDGPGDGYHRRFPHPVDRRRVAEVVVRCIEDDIPSRTVPRWLGLAATARAATPRVYRTLAARFG